MLGLRMFWARFIYLAPTVIAGFLVRVFIWCDWEGEPWYVVALYAIPPLAVIVELFAIAWGFFQLAVHGN